ncbi:MAG TPA: endo-1,4-beta-xylanase, partial [Chitinophagaceae bacterium]|nr:endo-1,4-beta-xylanase [Chitinophagaceae bacterium]
CCMVACRKNNGFGETRPNIDYDTLTPLHEAADFPIGVAISYTPTMNDAKYLETVKRDFDAVTFDYHMKHGAIVQDNGTLDFSRADQMINKLGGIEVFGHTLGWHQNQNANYLKQYAGLVAISGEKLTNPGFEGGLANWSVWNTGNPAGTSTISAGSGPDEVRTGTGSMKVVNPVGYPGSQWRVQVASQLFPTVVGRQYVISYWVKAASAGGSIRMSTQDQNNGNAQYQGDQTIGTAWQQIVWTITANSAQTRFLFDMGQAANTYFIDDASFKEILPPSTGPQIAAKVDEALNAYVTGMVNHFKSKVKAWDVVNELFADNGSIRTNDNTTQANDVFVWSHYMGRDYALKAFNYAKAADPNAILYINDYGLETNAQKLDSLIAFVNELKSKGAKVDGIGTQMHIFTTTPYAGIDDMMRKLAATGLLVRISELDVRTGGTAPGEQSFEAKANQAVMYKYVIGSYLRHVPPAQRGGVTVWGLSDNYSWLYNNGVEHPLLYDQGYNRKPAYTSFLQALRGQ